MKSKIKIYIFIAIISIIFSIPLLRQDFNIYRDDGIQHICRLMGTQQSITEMQTFPVIMSAFCNNFGYSWNLFYSPLTAYVPLLFHLFTNSFALCLKLFMIVIVALSGITMYEFVYKVTKSKCCAMLSSIIYIFLPYRFTDMYMRVAVAELASFVFLPLVFHGLYNIYDAETKKNKGMLLIIGAVGLVLTHTIIAMYTAIFCFIYVIINIKKLKNKNILLNLIISSIFILLITSFYWAPMLEHKLDTDYEVFVEGRMESTEKIMYFKTDLLQLVYTGQNAFSIELGLITIIGLVLTLLVYKKIDKRYMKIYIFSLIAGLASVILTLKWFPFEKLPSVLKLLQFPFRMFEFSSFFFSFIVAVNYSLIIKNFGKKDVAVLGTICILLMLPLVKNIDYDIKYKENSLWPAARVTEQTKRVHAGCATFEYLPSKAFNNLDYIKTRDNKIHVIEGNAQISNEEKNGTNMTFDINNVTANTTLELPYIYYLGYNVSVQNNNGEIKEIEIYESNNGFVQICLDSIENGKIEVKYTGTNIMKYSMAISIISITIMLLLYVKAVINKN